MRRVIQELIQQALNRYLSLDSASKTRLHALNGKVLSIELRGLAFSFQLIFHENHVKCHTQSDTFLKPTTCIKGTPLSLLRLTLSRNERHRFFSDDVIIEGDAEVGQRVIALFDELEIDWEEALSRIVGDVPSYHVGRWARDFKRASTRLRQTVGNNMNEYIHEEKNIFPAREALADFFNDVDILRMDVDRLEARVAQLNIRVQKERGNTP